MTVKALWRVTHADIDLFPEHKLTDLHLIGCLVTCGNMCLVSRMQDLIVGALLCHHVYRYGDLAMEDDLAMHSTTIKLFNNHRPVESLACNIEVSGSNSTHGRVQRCTSMMIDNNVKQKLPVFLCFYSSTNRGQ